MCNRCACMRFKIQVWYKSDKFLDLWSEWHFTIPLSSSYKTAHGHWPHVNVCRVSCWGVINMLLVLWLPLIFIPIYGVVCVQLAHFSIGDWKDISIAHVIIIIKSEVSTFPIVIIFFRGCVSEMFATSYSVTYCIYIPGKPGICFNYYCAVYDECKYSDTFCLEYRIRLFVHYTISLSSLCKLNWRHWTYKMPVRYILSSVWVR